MTWKATVREPITVVPEGEYEAMVSNVRGMKGNHGPMVRMDFVLRGHEDIDGHSVSGVASKRLSENTKLGRWVSAILGRTIEVGEEVQANDLLHKDCRVVVRHRTGDDGRVFGNVAEIMAQLPVPSAGGSARASQGPFPLCWDCRRLIML